MSELAEAVRWLRLPSPATSGVPPGFHIKHMGAPEIQKFAGALPGHCARKGVFITTSSFTNDAEEYVGRIDSKIILIDGPRLARLMVDHLVGVSSVRSYELLKVDSDYFTEE